MEARLGTDLTGVRVHRDAAADRLSRRLDARAFTSGRDIYFASGQYDEATLQGQELIAHELVHTMQQRNEGGASVGDVRRARMSDPGDASEREAERLATRTVRGASASVEVRGEGIARQVAEGPSAGPPEGEMEGAAPAFELRLPGVKVPIAADRGTVPLSHVADRIPGLRLGSLVLEARGGRIGKATVTATAALPYVLGDVSIGVDPTSGELTGGTGRLLVEVPRLVRGALDWEYAGGQLSGVLTVGRDRLRELGLPIESGSLTLNMAGRSLAVTAAATTGKSLPLISDGHLAVTYDASRESFAASVAGQVDVPGLERTDFTVAMESDGRWHGEGSIAANFAGASGSLHLVMDDWALVSAEGAVAYSRGPLSGTITARLVAANERRPGELAVSGDGDLTVTIAPWLTGTGHAVLHPDGEVDLEGALQFPEEVELFKERKVEKTLYQLDQEFPLWGITIPVVGSIGLIAEIHAKLGVRSRFGPGVLRDTVVEGTYSTRSASPAGGGSGATGDARSAPEPSFAVSGELFLPTGAELIVVVGGGVGLATLVAELTGGIDIAGSAGAYATLSVRPRFQYADGKYSFQGVAEIQAAALAKLDVNAYAAAEVGIGWLSKEVWRKEWNLLAFTWDPGLTFGLRARLDYTLGEPFEPNLEFEPVAIDPARLVRSALPNSGQPTPDQAQKPPPKASLRLEPPAAGPATTEPAPTSPGADRERGGRRGAARPRRGGGSSPAPRTTAGRGETTPPGRAGADEAAFVPPRPSALKKPAEERSERESWSVYVWDRFVDEQRRSTGRRVARAARGRASSSGRPSSYETRGPEASWRLYQQKLEQADRAKFDSQNEEKYYHPSRGWLPRRYFQRGKLREPAWPLYLPEEKWAGPNLTASGGSVQAGAVRQRYERRARAGRLRTDAPEARSDQRASFAEYIEDHPPPNVRTLRNHLKKPRGDDRAVDVDHIVELQVGGEDIPSNYQLLYSSPNSSSGATIRNEIAADKKATGGRELQYGKITTDRGKRDREKQAATSPEGAAG